MKQTVLLDALFRRLREIVCFAEFRFTGSLWPAAASHLKKADGNVLQDTVIAFAPHHPLIRPNMQPSSISVNIVGWF